MENIETHVMDATKAHNCSGSLKKAATTYEQVSKKQLSSNMAAYAYYWFVQSTQEYQ